MEWDSLVATGFLEKTAVGMLSLDCALLRVGMLQCLPPMTVAVSVFGLEVRLADTSSQQGELEFTASVDCMEF
jgi:hypothetical protein